MSDAYRQWIANTQCKPGFVNNYFSAVLFQNMEHNHKMHESFPIPLFLLEEELEREDQNTLLHPDRATVSVAIKYMMIDLLRLCRPREQVTVANYEAILRNVLDRDGILEGTPSPLDASTSFHCLPTLCKIFIIGLLRKHCRLPYANVSDAITSDTEKNQFYVLPEGRLYVYLNNNNVPATQAGTDKKPWTPLFVHTQQYRFNLLSETADEWAKVQKMLLTHGQQRACTTLSPFVEEALKYGEVRMSEERQDRYDFVAFLTPLLRDTPVPAQREASPESPITNLVEMSLVDWNEGKCAYFPQCTRKNCKSIHPDEECENFNQNRPCPGLSCLFLHGPCPIDGECDNDECIYEHYESRPVVLRKKRESRAPGVEKKNIRCQHFPKCRTSAAKCMFVHPTKMCKKFIESVCVQGKLCVYLHGNCPDDGECEDYECPREHYKSPPVAQRSKDPRRRDSFFNSVDRQRSRSRAISERCRRESSPEYASSRRSGLSNSNDYSDDDDEDKSQAGGRKTVEQRCRFFPGCKNEGKGCVYWHPKDPCKVFPNCPYGLACLFLHRTCPKDGVCVKEGCNHEHYLRRNIGKRWCFNGSVCKRKDCGYIHPKECRAPCNTPGACWMYHPVRTAEDSEAQPAARPAARSASRGRAPSRKRRSPSAPRQSTKGQKTDNKYR